MTAAVEPRVQEVEGGLELRVRVKPRAQRSQVLGVREGLLEVAVAALPSEGAANAELVRTLSACLGVPKSRVEVLAGTKSRLKRVRVGGLARAELLAKIAVER